jgi:LAO/AO transport system kinase
VLEVGDVFAVNKADTAGADRTVSALRESLEFRYGMQGTQVWQPPVLKTQALDGNGIDELVQVVDAHRQHFSTYPQELARRVRSQMRGLLLDRVAETLRARLGNEDARKDQFDYWLDEVIARRADPHTAVAMLLQA